MKKQFLSVFIILCIFINSCVSPSENAPKNTSGNDSINFKAKGSNAPEWSNNATIYELNIRQFSEAGDLNSIREQLPRLKKMGVEIIWLMPVYPISEKNKKGKLGSYYAIKDYKAINPEFGTMEDFKALVQDIHQHDMKVILDWVANHTGWDHVWIEEHPAWYTRDSLGNIVTPVEDWTDVADLNYDNDSLRVAMIDAMKFWVKETDIDGYRCDVAGMVPTEFWVTARAALDSIKPVFMLAEDEDPELLEKAFDMNYAWDFHHLVNDMAKGEKSLDDLDQYLKKEDSLYAEKDYRMYFITNHDENSWNGTIFERLGDAHKLYAVLTYTIDGMPLVYSGQEAAMDKRLKFFERDPIEWKDYPLEDFYTRLLQLKQGNQALWNGKYGGKLENIPSNNPKIYAYRRAKSGDEVIVVLNFDKAKEGSIQFETITGEYHDVFDDKTLVLKQGTSMTLPPNSFLVLEKSNNVISD